MLKSRGESIDNKRGNASVKCNPSVFFSDFVKCFNTNVSLILPFPLYNTVSLVQKFIMKSCFFFEKENLKIKYCLSYL